MENMLNDKKINNTEHIPVNNGPTRKNFRSFISV